MLRRCREVASAFRGAELSERLGALAGGELPPLAAVLLRAESASSLQIEQITVGASALALALASLGENAALVAANTDALQTAIALSDEISAATIIDARRAPLERTAPEHRQVPR